MSTPEQRLARDRFGGVKPGAAFLGFAAAYGLASLITGVAALVAVFAGVPITPTSGVNDVVAQPQLASESTSQLLGLVVGLLAVAVAYYLGGYVAGRMARFDGARQGAAVWAWGLVVGLAVAALGFVLGGTPGAVLDIVAATPTTFLLGVLLVLVVQLVAAVVGGLAGMRFHRRVDRAEAEPLVAPDAPRDHHV